VQQRPKCGSTKEAACWVLCLSECNVAETVLQLDRKLYYVELVFVFYIYFVFVFCKCFYFYFWFLFHCIFILYSFSCFLAFFDFFLLFGLFIFFLCVIPPPCLCVHFLFYLRSAIIFSISFHPSIFLLLLLSLFSFIFVVAVFITPLVSWECLLLQLRASSIVHRFSMNSLLLKTF
jgi:hypothetical protein